MSMRYIVGLPLLLLGLPGAPGLVFLTSGRDLTVPRAVVIILGAPFYVPLVLGLQLVFTR